MGYDDAECRQCHLLSPEVGLQFPKLAFFFALFTERLNAFPGEVTFHVCDRMVSVVFDFTCVENCTTAS